MQPLTYIVTGPDGLFVHSKPDTETRTRLRKMATGEGFSVYGTFYQGSYLWGRLTNNATTAQEYACLQIANKPPLAILADVPPTAPDDWVHNIDAWARSQGYRGPRP